MKALIMGTGKMGQGIKEVIESKGGSVLAMADCLDPAGFENLQEKPDVILDFSHRNNLPLTIELAQKYSIPAVIGTTGLNDEDLNLIEQASENIPVFFASNYSLGIALLTKLSAMAAKILSGKWDMEVVETHHNQKKDAPSGTALSLVEALDPEHEFKRVYGRSGTCPRDQKEIGIHAIRGGTVAGEHSVFFFGNNEQLELRHLASSRSIFTNGAVEAAQWIIGNQEIITGLYNMEDMLSDVLKESQA